MCLYSAKYSDLNLLHKIILVVSCVCTIASKISDTPNGVMKFDRSNKFDFCYYGQVNSLRLKSSVASKWASKHLWGGIIYFAGDTNC